MSKFIRITLLLVLLAMQTMCTATFLKGNDDSHHDREVCPHKSPLCIFRQENACYRFNNCVFYQVTPQFNDYACSQCEYGYQLQEDANQGGVCVREKKPSHCVWKAINPASHDGKRFCYQCKRGYVLSADGFRCYPMCELVPKVENCESYIQLEDGSVVCQSCKAGFTVTEDGRQCLEDCKLENCDSGAIVKGETYCFSCNKGAIGVWDTTLQVYTSCITCRDWQCHLLTGDAQKCCFERKH